MNKIIFCLPVLLLFLSCKESKELKIEFNDSIEINDLLSQNKYLKLNRDEDYKDYINEFYDTWIDFNSTVYRGNDLIAEASLVEADKNSDMSFDLFLSVVKGAGAAVDGFQLSLLEGDKEELYQSYSNEKIVIADDFEETLIGIINNRNSAPKNSNVDSTGVLQNYKSFGSEIKNDDKLRDDLDDLTDKVDELFLLGFKIRIQQNMNLELGKDLDDFTKIYDEGLQVIANNGNYPLSTNSELLNKYFKTLNNILEDIQDIEKGFTVPIEDWSENKKNNYLFIKEDIIIKLKEDLLSFKINHQNKADLIIEESTESNIDDEYLSKLFHTYAQKIESEDFMGALNVLENGIEKYPDNGDLYNLRGFINYTTTNYEEAVKDFEKAKELIPSDYEVYQFSGIAKFAIKDYEGGIEDLNIFLSSNTSDNDDRMRAYYNRGACKGMLGKYNEAIPDFTAAIELQGEENKNFIHMWRGRSKYFINEFEGSLEDYNIAIQRNPNVTFIYAERARTKEALEDYNGAINDYTMALELSPNEAYLYAKRANAYLNMAIYNKTIMDCDKALELEPENGDTYLIRGKAKMAIGEKDEACKDFHLAKEYGESEGTVDYAISEFCGNKEVN